MTTGILHIDLEAIAANWRALDAMSGAACETAAVVKADAYGLGVAPVATRLAAAGVRAFFVADASEGREVRRALGPEPRIFVLYGHMAGDTDTLARDDLVPMLTSMPQLLRHLEALPRHPFGLQLDTGMSRLGLTAPEWAASRDLALQAGPVLIMSHLASADEPDDPANVRQRARFVEMTDGTGVPRSLSATGGALLGPDYRFDMIRPGIGLYGGLPFRDAEPVVALDLPVIACFDLPAGAAVGYGGTWVAPSETRIATVAGGYADGLHRSLQPGLDLMAGPVACPVRGRVSMDTLCVDIGHLDADPDALTLLDGGHGIDALADIGCTIGYEVLTALGRRYARRYRGHDPR